MLLRSTFCQAVIFSVLAGTIRCNYVTEQAEGCETLTAIIPVKIRHCILANTLPFQSTRIKKAE